MRSRSRCSGAYEETFIRAGEQARPGAGWKAIVKTYLRPEFCEHPERGCPLAALAPELARADKGMKPQIVAELVNYKNQMLPFMPGRRTVDIKTTWSKSRLFVLVLEGVIPHPGGNQRDSPSDGVKQPTCEEDSISCPLSAPRILSGQQHCCVRRHANYKQA
jgi:hypothetical protein